MRSTVKRSFILVFGVGIVLGVLAMRWAYHNLPPVFSTSVAKEKNEHFIPHHERRAGLFALSQVKNPIVMLGDSITEEADWHDLSGCPYIVNNGIGSNTSGDMLARLPGIIDRDPRAVFLMVGAVDAFFNADKDVTIKNVTAILDRLSEKRIPVVFQYTLPARQSSYDGRTNENINSLNRAYDEILKRHPSVKVVDLRPEFRDPNGFLRVDLSYDDLHIAPAGYKIWRETISPLIASFCKAVVPTAVAPLQTKPYLLNGAA